MTDYDRAGALLGSAVSAMVVLMLAGAIHREHPRTAIALGSASALMWIPVAYAALRACVIAVAMSWRWMLS